MSKAKLFVENFLVYGLGGIISKAIPLIMIPIVTRLMPNTTYFGISDMSQTIISFGSALAVLGMYDAMYRMFFEKENEDYRKAVCSTTFFFTIITSLIVFLSMLIARNYLAIWFMGDSNLAYVICLSAIATLVTATNQIIAAPTRMLNKRKVFLVTNTVTPVLSYGISIPLLLKGYYIIALPLAGVLSGATMELSFFMMNHKWFQVKRFNKELLRELLFIAIPLFPNFIIYWIFNSSDRLMITHILGVGAEGVYSVGSKLGQASQLIYMAFAGGWQYFAFSTMKEENQVRSNSMVFEYLAAISFVATSFICAICFTFFKVLFTEEYLGGFIVAPYLFMAPLVQMLFQVACNQFLVIKKTWPNMFILLAGASINILLNLFLIPRMGIEGAAIATLMGYVISVFVAMLVLINMKLMLISKRLIFMSLCMAVYFVFWRLFIIENIIYGLILFGIFLSGSLLMYRNEIIRIKEAIKGKRGLY